MKGTLTVRTPVGIDSARLELRRGFLNVHTPVKHASELLIPIDQRREALKTQIAGLEGDRFRLWHALGCPNKKNFTHTVNKKPRRRARIRAGVTQNAQDSQRYLDIGRQIQELQKQLGALSKAVKP